jgi:hypothetical protein
LDNVNLVFKVELPKKVLIRQSITPGAYGEFLNLSSPENNPISGILIEKGNSKVGELIDFFPLELYGLVEANSEYLEFILVGVQYGNPEALDIKEELGKVRRHIEKIYKIAMSGNRAAVTAFLENMESK